MRRTVLLLLLLSARPSTAAAPIATLSVNGSEPIAISRLEGGEAISQLFRYELELAPPFPFVPFEALLGQDIVVTLQLPEGGTRYFSGICSRVSAGDRERVEIVPRLWLLTRRSRSRMFQDLSVPEIVARVLGETGIQSSMRLAGDFPRRDCVVQRNETDFDFISRLMEEEGIYYFFVHSAGGHEMVVGNSPQAHPNLPQGATVRWLGGQNPGQGVHEWTKVQELRSGRVTLRDHLFQFPDETFEASASIQESVQAGQVTHLLRIPESESLELYDYPGEYAQRFDGIATPDRGEVESEAQRTAAIRAGEEAARALVMQGAGELGQFTSGHAFVLAGHPNGNGRYVITQARHSWTALPGKRGSEFRTTFTCIPAGLPFHPPRATPRPLIAGLETAVVTGPPGAATHTDPFGRVKVKFHWDREGSPDENSSCWIRVGALHAGQQDGWTLVPEIGDEVLVAFEHGDPDQPVVVGSVWDASHRPPERSGER